MKPAPPKPSAENFRLRMAVSMSQQGNSLKAVTRLLRECGASDSEIERHSARAQQLNKHPHNLALPAATGPDDWKTEIPCLRDWGPVPESNPIVENILVSGGITALAGSFEVGKTMFVMEIAAAILQHRAAFDFLPAYSYHEILHLAPDMPDGLFLEYAKNFSLDREPGFRALNPDSDNTVAIDSPLLNDAVMDRVLILDTMLDFARLKDSFQSGEWITFFQRLRQLIRVHGCAAILLICHSTKVGARNTEIDATEFLKDSITFGGKLDTAFALRKTDPPEGGRVFVQRIKGRPFKGIPFKFTVAIYDDNGQSNISRGRFPVCDLPGDAGELRDHLRENKSGRKSNLTPDIRAQLERLHSERKTQREMAVELGVGKTTVQRWLDEAKESVQPMNTRPVTPVTGPESEASVTGPLRCHVHKESAVFYTGNQGQKLCTLCHPPATVTSSTSERYFNEVEK